jgi:hypothetical protein
VASIAIVVAYWETLTGAAHIPYDLEYYHFPLLYTVQEQIAAGSIPAWDPYNYGGIPLLANPQSGWAYPPHLMLDVVLDLVGRPLSQGVLQWFSAAHVWIAAMGTVTLARTRRLGDAGAAFAGVFVVLSGATVSQAQHLGMTETFAWLPWALVVVERMRERPRAAHVAALGFLVALMITPGFLPLVLLGCVFVAAYAATRDPRRPRAWVAPLAGLAIGTAIAAVALLPVAAIAGHNPELAPHSSLPVRAALTALFPNAFGHWLGGLDLYDGTIDVTRSYYYVGAGAIVLLPLALTSGRAVIGDAALAGALLLLSFGSIAQDAAEAVQQVPTGELYRPELCAYIATLPLALTLAHGLRRLPSARQLAALVLFLTVVAAVPLTNAHGRALHLLTDAPRRTILAIGVLVLLLGAAALLARRPRGAPRAYAVLAACALVAVVELASAVPDRYFVVAPGPHTRADANRTGDPSGVVGFLRRSVGEEERVATDAAHLPPEWAGFANVWRIQGTNGFQPQFTKHFLARVQRLGSDFEGRDRILPVTPGEEPMFRELGVHHVVVAPARDPFAGRAAYRRVFDDGIYRVYRFAGPHRRAQLIDRACLAARGDEFAADCVSAPVRTDLLDDEERRYALPRGSGGRLLLTGEQFYPGWSARTDRGDVDVERLGYLAVVDVPAGATEVTMEYRPPLLVLGAVVSGLAVLGAALAVILEARRRRARPTRS